MVPSGFIAAEAPRHAHQACARTEIACRAYGEASSGNAFVQRRAAQRQRAPYRELSPTWWYVSKRAKHRAALPYRIEASVLCAHAHGATSACSHEKRAGRMPRMKCCQVARYARRRAMPASVARARRCPEAECFDAARLPRPRMKCAGTVAGSRLRHVLSTAVARVAAYPRASTARCRRRGMCHAHAEKKSPPSLRLIRPSQTELSSGARAISPDSSAMSLHARRLFHGTAHARSVLLPSPRTPPAVRRRTPALQFTRAFSKERVRVSSNSRCAVAFDVRQIACFRRAYRRNATVMMRCGQSAAHAARGRHVDEAYARAAPAMITLPASALKRGAAPVAECASMPMSGSWRRARLPGVAPMRRAHEPSLELPAAPACATREVRVVPLFAAATATITMMRYARSCASAGACRRAKMRQPPPRGYRSHGTPRTHRCVAAVYA